MNPVKLFPADDRLVGIGCFDLSLLLNSLALLGFAVHRLGFETDEGSGIDGIVQDSADRCRTPGIKFSVLYRGIVGEFPFSVKAFVRRR